MPFSNDSWTDFIKKNGMMKQGRGEPDPNNRFQAVYATREYEPLSLFMLSIDGKWVVIGPEDDEKMGQHSRTMAPLVRKLLETRLNEMADGGHHSISRRQNTDDDERYAWMDSIADDVEAGHYQNSGSDSEDEFHDAPEKKGGWSGSLEELMSLYRARSPPPTPTHPQAALSPLQRAQQESGKTVYINDEGARMQFGSGGNAQTLYCGQEKTTKDGTFLKTCFTPRLVNTYPGDHRCGPYNGLQCNACKVRQDLVITDVTLENCHLKFLEKLEGQLAAHLVNATGDNTQYSEILVCKGPMVGNKSSKIAFATALEMLGEFCVKSNPFKMGAIYNTTIDTEHSACDVVISCPGPIRPAVRSAASQPPKDLILNSNCTYVCPRVSHTTNDEGWDGSHIKCVFVSKFSKQ